MPRNFWSHLVERDEKILSMLRASSTPLWANDICVGIGLKSISDMEKVRSRLNRMIKSGLVERVAPFDMSGRQYYRATSTDTGSVT